MKISVDINQGLLPKFIFHNKIYLYCIERLNRKFRKHDQMGFGVERNGLKLFALKFLNPLSPFKF